MIRCDPQDDLKGPFPRLLVDFAEGTWQSLKKRSDSVSCSRMITLSFSQPRDGAVAKDRTPRKRRVA